MTKQTHNIETEGTERGSSDVAADATAMISLLATTAFSPPHRDAIGACIIMPTNGRPEFVIRALEMMGASAYPSALTEIVIVDDSRAGLRLSNASAYPSLTYVTLDHAASVGAKRNIAVNHCSKAAEVIVHWDDDDIYAPSRLSAQILPIARGTADITLLKHDHTYFMETDQLWGADGGPHFGTMTWRRSLFNAAAGVAFPDSSQAEDYGFAQFAVSKAGARLLIVTQPSDETRPMFVCVRHGSNTWEWRQGALAATQRGKRQDINLLSDADRAFAARLRRDGVLSSLTARRAASPAPNRAVPKTVDKGFFNSLFPRLGTGASGACSASFVARRQDATALDAATREVRARAVEMSRQRLPPPRRPCVRPLADTISYFDVGDSWSYPRFEGCVAACVSAKGTNCTAACASQWRFATYDLTTETAYTGSGGLLGVAATPLAAHGGAFSVEGDLTLTEDLELAYYTRLRVTGSFDAAGHDVTLGAFAALTVGDRLSDVGMLAVHTFAALNVTGDATAATVALRGNGDCALPTCDASFFGGDARPLVPTVVNGTLTTATDLTATNRSDLRAGRVVVANGSLAVTGESQLHATGLVNVAGALSVFGTDGQMSVGGDVVVASGVDVPFFGALSVEGSLNASSLSSAHFGAVSVGNDVVLQPAGSVSMDDVATIKVGGRVMAGDASIGNAASFDVKGDGTFASLTCENCGGLSIEGNVEVAGAVDASCTRIELGGTLDAGSASTDECAASIEVAGAATVRGKLSVGGGGHFSATALHLTTTAPVSVDNGGSVLAEVHTAQDTPVTLGPGGCVSHLEGPMGPLQMGTGSSMGILGDVTVDGAVSLDPGIVVGLSAQRGSLSVQPGGDGGHVDVVNGAVALGKGASLSVGTMAATTLVLDSGSQLEVRGTEPVSVAREVWLAPHFITKCPGDSEWVAAGDNATHDGVCPWASETPATDCTVQQHTCGPANATDHAASWLLGYAAGLRGAPPRCLVGPKGKLIFKPMSGFDPTQACGGCS